MTQQVHPDGDVLGRYFDHALGPDERAQVETHLADCAECRATLYEVGSILHTQPRRRWASLVPLVAAAAVLLLVWSGSDHRPPTGPVTRDPALTTTRAPQPVAPLGSVSRVEVLQWSPVPGALRYRLTVFSGDGEVVWRTTVTDTAVAPPDSLRWIALTPYYWQIKAETSHGRWVESELVTFTLTAPGAP
jgi:anti-sigma factor RsiW